ncbi:hypothetical protein [Roseicella aquatilis]|uniref:Uncharacterized protein n=1 Tax=Roseicella aquatilis TaxID=2527868 RepID=A0A4R4D4H2_9PROT|nr:hypothetical protein [Roseicella aquatilis]TCZ53401.1 hypothetical protein EXY23_24720 [Roseicella aquatilis]
MTIEEARGAMFSVTDQRAFGSILLASYLPCAYRKDPKLRHAPTAEEAISWESFEEITNGAWRPAPKVSETNTGSGTTCGFLPAWFLWRLGCIDGNLVNRTCRSAGGAIVSTYEAGWNICAVRGACAREARDAQGNVRVVKRRQHACYVKIHDHAENTRRFAAGELRPRLGDIIHVNTQPGTNRDHVFIYLNDFEDPDGTERWQTAEAGGPTPEYAGKQMEAPFWREQAVFSNKRTVAQGAGPIRLLSREPGMRSPVSDTRTLMGWVDLDRITGWDAPVFDPGRRSSVPGYPPPVKLPNGQTMPWSVLAAAGGVLPGLGGGAPPSMPPLPGDVTLPGGISIPNPFGGLR